LVEIAILLQRLDPGSERATELINAAEQKMRLEDPLFLPWSRAVDRASIEAARGNKQTALKHLGQAIELGLRYRWQSNLMTNIAFNSLHDEPEFKQLISKIEEDMQLQREEAYRLLGDVK